MVPLELIGRTLFKKLDETPVFTQCNNIIIENQPVLKNPKMKSIASTLYSYFLIRGIVDRTKNNSFIEKVQYISPCNKLKVSSSLQGPDNVLMLERVKNAKQPKTNTAHKGEQYRLTKKLAVQYCKLIIQPDVKNYDLLCSHKKKDDLSDCLLQGIYYMTK